MFFEHCLIKLQICFHCKWLICFIFSFIFAIFRTHRSSSFRRPHVLQFADHTWYAYPVKPWEIVQVWYVYWMTSRSPSCAHIQSSHEGKKFYSVLKFVCFVNTFHSCEYFVQIVILQTVPLSTEYSESCGALVDICHAVIKRLLGFYHKVFRNETRIKLRILG